MNATMEDIARDAGVSISTVSRIINGYKGISEELRRRVEESICKYNYKPNAAARSLITKRTDLIAVGCIRYLQSMKLRVPEDISVFGHDDSLEDIFEIELSTVRSENNGQIICEHLFAEQESRAEKERVYYPHRLIRRQSTRRIGGEMQEKM